MNTKKYFLIIFSLAVSFLFAAKADAAILYALPESKSFNIGQQFFVDIKVNTSDDFINAAQATINFSNDVLEVVGVDKSSSVFSFWIGEPEISNENGTISFIGGAAKGLSGESLQILRVNFKTIGSGVADISLSDAVVTASDGKGTNILSVIEGTKIAVGVKVVAPEVPTAPAEELSPELAAPVPVPVKVERVAVIARDLPKKPELTIPLYPDESKWYSHQRETVVMWEVPQDVISVAIAVDDNPKTEPPEPEEELYTGKNLGLLPEGVSYVHVQFKNNIGWGEVVHYKISIDTTSPLSFETEMSSKISDDPSPEISFSARDTLSGYSHTYIYIDEEEPIKINETSFILPIQKPGEHTLKVRVFDNAGNSIQDVLEFEILPLEPPVVDFVTARLSQGEYIFTSGKTVPNGFADIKFIKDDEEIFSTEAKGDAFGKWQTLIKEALPKGNYEMIVSARDIRGAISYPIDPVPVKIGAKVILSFGFVELGWFEIGIIFVLIVMFGGGLGTWLYFAREETRKAYKIIAGRDVTKFCKMLDRNTEAMDILLKQQKRMAHQDKILAQTYMKNINNIIFKMKKYLGLAIEKLK